MLLILKFVKNVKVNVVMRQHIIWCVYVLSAIRHTSSHELPEDDLNKIETCWSVFKCVLM